MWRPRAAGGRDDSVHAEVLDHLAVVISRMPCGDVSDGETRVEEWEHGLGQRRYLVFRGDRSNGVMAKREGILKILDYFRFGLELGGAVGVLFEGFHIDVLAHERAEEKVIGETDVFHFFRERAHALELAAGRRERVFFFGHGLGGGNHLPLDDAVKRVEDGRGCGRLLRRR